MISAEVICDSISPEGKRLTTFKLRYPKFIHGEFMTHRRISRNASSSRAIPTAKYLEEVRSDALRAAPVFWGVNQKGMQAAVELDDSCADVWSFGSLTTLRQAAKEQWDEAAIQAAKCAEELAKLGAHKQIVNRILEPFLHINVVATATEWANFFGLRLHKDAQPEMRVLAFCMLEAIRGSVPNALRPGEWHLPFILAEEWQDHAEGDWPIERIIKVSVARCARVSYESFETGKLSTIEEDLKLYEKLVGSHPMHASPAEHQATPDKVDHGGELGRPRPDWVYPEEHGNFVGWRQYRKMLPGESCAPVPQEFQ